MGRRKPLTERQRRLREERERTERIEREAKTKARNLTSAYWYRSVGVTRWLIGAPSNRASHSERTNMPKAKPALPPTDVEELINLVSDQLYRRDNDSRRRRELLTRAAQFAQVAVRLRDENQIGLKLKQTKTPDWIIPEELRTHMAGWLEEQVAALVAEAKSEIGDW